MPETNLRANRRTVLKGSAWVVPVIATAGAVPVASASPIGAPCLQATYTINSRTSSSATGSWRFQMLCPAKAGEYITVLISPDTTSGQMFQMQATLAHDFLRVPTNSAGSVNGTTKALEIIHDVSTGDVAFANFNFSGYYSEKPTITVMFRGQVIAAYTHT